MAILNSQLFWWFLQQTGTVLANNYFRFMPRYIEAFPIPEITDIHKTKPFEDLVDMVIADKKKKIDRELAQLLDFNKQLKSDAQKYTELNKLKSNTPLFWRLFRLIKSDTGIQAALI